MPLDPVSFFNVVCYSYRPVTMRTSLALVALLLTASAATVVVSAGGAPRPLPEHGCAKAVAEQGAFYHKVGYFAVVIYSLWHDISPVPVLECVVSATTRPARGNAVDYLLVLRVAGLGTCEALVWGVRGEGSQDWKLKYFKQVAN
uniref:Uncharacterized protein n=1 Tax=Avena sativa TaxID=4498 RepID=A0ACD6AI83_AVESA